MKRINAFLIGLLLFPILMLVSAMVLFLAFLLPVLCAINPKVIKFNK